MIDVCEALGVKHLIYSGLEHVKKVIGIECGEFLFLDNSPVIIFVT